MLFEVNILGLPFQEDVNDKMRVDTITGPHVEKQIPLDFSVMAFSKRALLLAQGCFNVNNRQLTHAIRHFETGAQSMEGFH